MRVVIVAAPGVPDIIARCVSDNEVPDSTGWIARGFTNMKRILGSPRDFEAVVEELAKTVPAGHAVAGADEGSWALVGALALRLGIQAVLVRRTPKTYFVSYGDDPTVGDGRLVGERLVPGLGSTWWMTWCIPGRHCALPLMRCVESISPARLLPQSFGPGERRHQKGELEACGLEQVTCLVSQADMPDRRWKVSAHRQIRTLPPSSIGQALDLSHVSSTTYVADQLADHMAGVLREGPDRPRRSGYGRWCEQVSCPRRATRARWHGRACRVIGAACSVSAAGAVDDRLADAGVRLLLKREDPINLEVPGNKWRKLKYNLAEAERSGHRTLLTFGGAYSNHIRATAAAGELFGFTTIGVIRGEQHLPLNESLSYAVQRGMRLDLPGSRHL